MAEQRYELMYGLGGHGGPYFGLQAARAQANLLLAGSRHECTIYIVPYDERPFSHSNAVETVRKDRRSGSDRRSA